MSYSLVQNGVVVTSFIGIPGNTSTVSFGSSPTVADYKHAGYYVEVIPAFDPVRQYLTVGSIDAVAGTVTFVAANKTGDDLVNSLLPVAQAMYDDSIRRKAKQLAASGSPLDAILLLQKEGLL